MLLPSRRRNNPGGWQTEKTVPARRRHCCFLIRFCYLTQITFNLDNIHLSTDLRTLVKVDDIGIEQTDAA